MKGNSREKQKKKKRTPAVCMYVCALRRKNVNEL